MLLQDSPLFAFDSEKLRLSAPAKTASAFSTFIRDTRPFLDGRLRYEWADIEGFDGSYVLSLRNRLGLETGTLAGVSFLVEGEYTKIGRAHV